jgi:hypothetical protein
MALLHFDLGRFLSLLIFLHSRVDSLKGGSACHKVATCAQDKHSTQTSVPQVRIERKMLLFERAKTATEIGQNCLKPAEIENSN